MAYLLQCSVGGYFSSIDFSFFVLDFNTSQDLEVLLWIGGTYLFWLMLYLPVVLWRPMKGKEVLLTIDSEQNQFVLETNFFAKQYTLDQIQDVRAGHHTGIAPAGTFAYRRYDEVSLDIKLQKKRASEKKVWKTTSLYTLNCREDESIRKIAAMAQAYLRKR